MMKFFIDKLFILPTLVIIIFSCARVGSPTGGIKDITPPKVISTNPQNYQTNFDAKDFEITFDNFIELKDVNNELMISPPLKEKPTVMIHGKSIKVEINNELQDSVTYTFNFANSIVDYTEGNILPGYEYVFSTGLVIDSLSVSGTILNSFDLIKVDVKETPVFILIYDNLADSCPFTIPPLYNTKLRSDGTFSINNVKPGTYKIFALADNNRNLLFDQVDESIAFSDSFVVVNPEFFDDTVYSQRNSRYDTIAINYPDKKTIRKQNIPIPLDSSAYVFTKKRYSFPVDLLMFQEFDSTQYLSDFSRKGKSVLNLAFKRPISDSMTIEPINFTIKDKNWMLLEDPNYTDTMHYWIVDTTIRNIDTLLICFGYNYTDTLNNYVWKLDTLKFVTKREKERELRLGKKKSESNQLENDVEPLEKLNISCSLSSNAPLDLDKKVILKLSSPVNTINTSNIMLYQVIDTIRAIVPYTIVADTSNVLWYYLNANWQSQTKYELNIFPGSFIDIYGVTNDTIICSNTTQEKEYYGTLFLTVDSFYSDLIIQLMNAEGKIIQEKLATPENNKIEFLYVLPGMYTLKAIFDTNKNKQWDTGSYRYKLQPEKIVFFSGELKIRSNWDMEQKWILNE